MSSLAINRVNRRCGSWKKGTAEAYNCLVRWFPIYHAGDLIISDSLYPSHCNTSDLSPPAHARSKNCGCFSGVRCTRALPSIVKSSKIADSSGMTSRRNSSHRGADYRSRVSNASIQGAPGPSPGCPGLAGLPLPHCYGVCVLFCHSLSASSPRPSES